MKLLATYEDKDEAEIALTKISGEKRLASERDSTVVIYNLFGEPTWGNFYKLDRGARRIRKKSYAKVFRASVRAETSRLPVCGSAARRNRRLG